MLTAKNEKIEKHFSQKNLLYICVHMKYESFNASYGATQQVIYSHPHIIYFSFSHFSSSHTMHAIILKNHSHHIVRNCIFYTYI